MQYQDIIQTILDNSVKEVARIKESAKQECAAIKEKSDQEVKAIREKAQMDAKVMRAEVLSRRLTVADLDVKKILLNARQEIIDQVYLKAQAKLKSLSDKEYKKLIEGMITLGAADGDVVVVGKKDQKVITSAFVKKIADKKGIALGGVAYDERIDGGIVLRGVGCDKNMTIDLEVASIKVETVTEISKRLFE